MRSPALCISLVALLLPTVAAQFGGGDPDDFGSSGIHFDAPPLEIANIAFYAIFFLATLIQLGLVASFLCRSRSPHLLPAFGAVVALVFLALSYALGVASTVTQYIFDGFGDQILSQQGFLNLQIPTDLFFDWVDPMMFLAVALVLRDRFLTHTKNAAPTENRVVPLLPFTMTSYFLCTLLFTLSTASEGVFGAAFTSFYLSDIGVSELNSQLKVSNNLGYAFIAIVITTTIFLVAFAVVVRKYAKNDKIMTVTLWGIMPFLCLRALARLIFVIIDATLPLSKSFTLADAYALDFSSTVIYGGLFFVVACMLVHFFMSPQLWYGAREQVPLQYGGYPPQRYPYYQGGMQPVAQFPGQWGSTGQPQPPLPYGHAAPNAPYQGANGGYPFPQGAAYHPDQQPHMPPSSDAASTPGEGKMPEGMLHPHTNQTPPPPTS